MKIDNLWFYVAGLAMGAALSGTIALWGEATVAYRCVFIVLLGLLSFATWSKGKPYESKSTTDGKPLDTLTCEGSCKNDNNANNGDN